MRHPRVIEELIPAACHVTEQYANNPAEADHGRLKSWLRPMRGLTTGCGARIITAGHGFAQNIRRGHYEPGTGEPANLRVPAAFDDVMGCFFGSCYVRRGGVVGSSLRDVKAASRRAAATVVAGCRGAGAEFRRAGGGRAGGGGVAADTVRRGTRRSGAACGCLTSPRWLNGEYVKNHLSGPTLLHKGD
ncbi:MAG: DDE-type integrase/transposase/recombinase [Pseudonocardiaceae bacterium]